MNYVFTKIWLLVRSKAGVAAIALMCACVAVIAYRLIYKDRNESEGLSLLKETYKGRRSIESRIAGFEYAPFISVRGEGEESAPDSLSLAYAERVVLDTAYYKDDAESYHVLGVYYLLSKQYDKAVSAFEKALTHEPSNAKLRNDLGAALLEKGKTELREDRLQSQFTGKAIESLSWGLEHIHKALDFDASLKEALFNLGLLQEELGLPFAARDTLSKYLELDASSGWAREAKDRIARQNEGDRNSSLSKEVLLGNFLDAFKNKEEDQAWKLICKNRNPLNGKYICELLVDAYIDQSLSLQKEEAANSLSALSFLAELEVKKVDEHYSEKLVKFYKTRRQSDLAQLKQARNLVKQGHELYLLDPGPEALAAYREAKNRFNSLEDLCESISVEYRIAYSHSERGNIKDSLPVFERLAGLCEKEKFKILHVRNLLGLASCESYRNKYSKAIRHAFRSFEIGKEVEDELSVFTSLGSLADFYKMVRNHKKSLACIQNNLEYAACSSITQLQNFGYYSRMASVLSSAELLASSLEYRKEASKFLNRKVSRNEALYLTDLGVTYAKAKNYAEAEINLNQGYDKAQAISSGLVRNHILTYITLQRGSFHRDRKEFEDALSNYNEALNLSLVINYPVYTYQARKGRLVCYIALGEDAMAEQEISETLRLLEASRAEILEHENRNSFFDAEQDIYDLAIDYEFSRRNNVYKAFAYSEESRARSLLDLLTKQAEVKSGLTGLDIKFKGGSSPLTLQAIQLRLPERLQVIQYSVLADKIIIWVLSSSSINYSVVGISQEELYKKISDYLNKISHYSNDQSYSIATQSKELSDILIKPVANMLSRDGTLCIVPEKALNNLPFETLISTETQNYLIEDFPVIYCPSSSVLIECIERAKSKPATDAEKLLGIGNPSFDISVFKELSNLPAAETEVANIATYYQANPVILTKGAAREEKVKSEMQKATVIHFATHSLLDEDSYLRSKILLARGTTNTSEDSDGVLESGEIYETTFQNAKIVVLSSCQSGIDRYYRGEGMMSLARSFMAAGVPTVVASLWKVDSNAAADLMIDFHRYKQQQNLSVAESLRMAKLNMLKDQGGSFRHPYFWSAFIAVGGQASF